MFGVRKVWQKCLKYQFGIRKFGKILIIAVELQHVWQIKFGDLVKFAKFPNFLLSNFCPLWYTYTHAYILVIC